MVLCDRALLSVAPVRFRSEVPFGASSSFSFVDASCVFFRADRVLALFAAETATVTSRREAFYLTRINRVGKGTGSNNPRRSTGKECAADLQRISNLPISVRMTSNFCRSKVIHTAKVAKIMSNWIEVDRIGSEYSSALLRHSHDRSMFVIHDRCRE